MCFEPASDREEPNIREGQTVYSIQLPETQQEKQNIGEKPRTFFILFCFVSLGPFET